VPDEEPVSSEGTLLNSLCDKESGKFRSHVIKRNETVYWKRVVFLSIISIL
jgi:hypothetical protein